jgi:two-component system, OmpR family, sensor histidine kinase KdpD
MRRTSLGALARPALLAAASVLVVALAGAALVAADADLPIALVVLLLVVVGVSTWGSVPGFSAALAGSAVLTYYFTPPTHSFTIDRTDDVVALVAFLASAGVTAAVVGRLHELRRRSDLGAQEALLRLALVDRLVTESDQQVALDAATEELTALFDLSSCIIVTAGGHRYGASGGRAGAESVRVATSGITFELELNRPLSDGDLSMIEAFGASLAALLDRIRLDAEATTHRVRGELDRSRAGFLTAVTHDLRTPLATIKASTAALLVPDAQLDSASRREMLELAHGEATRLEGIVTNVLEMTRIRAGALRPEPSASSAVDLVQGAVSRLRHLADDREIQLGIAPEVPPVWADPRMMEYVLANLLENALRYSSPDLPIDIGARAGNGDVELTVADHGPGIPVGSREHIFDEFVRLDPRESSGGTGLGLAIVQAFVAANGGRVRCEETKGGGATFVVALPMATKELAS